MFTEALRQQGLDAFPAFALVCGACAISAIMLASPADGLPTRAAAFVSVASLLLASLVAMLMINILNNRSEPLVMINFLWARFLTDTGLSVLAYRMATDKLKWGPAVTGAFYNFLWTIPAIIVAAILF